MTDRARGRRPLLLFLGVLFSGAARARPVRAQSEPAVTQPSVAPEAADDGARLRLSLGLGMGITWDGTGFTDRDVAAIPSFAVSAEAHGETFGIALGLVAVSASGRFPYQDTPVDRLGFDVALTARPFSRVHDALGIARRFTIALGPGWEEVAAGTASVGRLGLRASASLDVVSWADPRGSVFKVRATARRFWGPERTLGMQTVGDTRMDLGLVGAVDF